jgi:hypothetical protein
MKLKPPRAPRIVRSLTPDLLVGITGGKQGNDAVVRSSTAAVASAPAAGVDMNPLYVGNDMAADNPLFS